MARLKAIGFRMDFNDELARYVAINEYVAINQTSLFRLGELNPIGDEIRLNPQYIEFPPYIIEMLNINKEVNKVDWIKDGF